MWWKIIEFIHNKDKYCFVASFTFCMYVPTCSWTWNTVLIFHRLQSNNANLPETALTSVSSCPGCLWSGLPPGWPPGVPVSILCQRVFQNKLEPVTPVFKPCPGPGHCKDKGCAPQSPSWPRPHYCLWRPPRSPWRISPSTSTARAPVGVPGLFYKALDSEYFRLCASPSYVLLCYNCFLTTL